MTGELPEEMMIQDVALPEMLTAHDRCDGCGAQGYVRVIKAGWGAPLTFCGHHYGASELQLASQGFVVLTDERDRINVKPSPSANVD